jgi:hypothetical protein
MARFSCMGRGAGVETDRGHWKRGIIAGKGRQAEDWGALLGNINNDEEVSPRSGTKKEVCTARNREGDLRWPTEGAARMLQTTTTTTRTALGAGGVENEKSRRV